MIAVLAAALTVWILSIDSTPASTGDVHKSEQDCRAGWNAMVRQHEDARNDWLDTVRSAECVEWPIEALFGKHAEPLHRVLLVGAEQP